MLNKFRNALYGTSSSNDDSTIGSVYTDYKEAVLGRRFRGALTRSSSFREDLLNEVSKSRTDGEANASGSHGPLQGGNLQRGRSQVLRKSATTIPEDDEQYSSNQTRDQQQQQPATAAPANSSSTSSTSTSSSSSGGSSGRIESNGRAATILKNKGQGQILGGSNPMGKPLKYRYKRPEFLQLRTDDEIIVSADHQIRPIILPRDVTRLPWKSGYAECINAGKSAANEDQASCYQDVAIGRSGILTSSSSGGGATAANDSPTSDGTSNILHQIPWTYFGLFDGHAGSAVAVAASVQLHNILSEKLRSVADLLIALEFDLRNPCLDVESTDGDHGQDDDDDDDASGTSEAAPLEASEDGPRSPTEASESQAPSTSSGALNGGGNDSEFEDCQSSPIDSKGANGSTAVEAPRGGATEAGQDEISKTTTSNRVPEEKADGEKTGESADEKSSSQQESIDHEARREEMWDGIAQPKFNRPARENQQQQEGCKDAKTKAWPRYPSEFLSHTESFPDYEPNDSFLPSLADLNRNDIQVESLVRGALESALWEMDELIAHDKLDFRMPGGCAVIVSLFILGKLFVCNAGDCRAIVCKSNGQARAMSTDFTPVSERRRILRLGMERPELLGKEFTHLEFLRRPTRKDLGKLMYYRDAYMTGWSLKEITYQDLRFPLVWGEGKRSRVLATIGVTRGLGDHELRAQYGSVPIKPFLTPEPEVRVLDLEENKESGKPWEWSDQDVLVMGTDGLWDVARNEEVAEIVARSLKPDNELSRSKYRYISAAQDLVIHSRGTHSTAGNTQLVSYYSSTWRMAGENTNKLASLDDISVFVIPLKAYLDEYLEWKRLRLEAAIAKWRRDHNL